MSSGQHVFTLAVGENRQQVAGRMDAVKRARELSGNTWRRVKVTREDEAVEMTFRRGELSTYTYHTRGRRGRGRHS